MSFEGTPFTPRRNMPYLMTLTGLHVTYGYNTLTTGHFETYEVAVSFAPNDVEGTLRVISVYDSKGVLVPPAPGGWTGPFMTEVMMSTRESLTEAYQAW